MFWEFFDWGIIAQVVFGLSIAFFALPVVIAHQSESLARHTKERLNNERASFRKEHGKTISQEYNKLGQLLAGVIEKAPDESKEKDIAECYKSVKRLRRMISKYVKGLKELGRWRTRSSILIRGVLNPAICLVLSAILSGLAWSLEESGLYLPLWVTYEGLFIPNDVIYSIYLNHFLLILAALSFSVGIYFGVKTLCVTSARS